MYAPSPASRSAFRLLALSCLLCGTSNSQSTYEQRHDAYFDDISGCKINTGQTDGPSGRRFVHLHLSK